MAKDNKSLGKFILDGIPPAPRGVPQVEVTFDIDANGILKVTAQDKATGRSQNITITASSGLSDDEVDRMTQEAEENAAEDAKRKALIEAKNNADSAVYTAEKALKDLDDKIDDDLKGKVDEAIKKVTGVIEGEDAEAITKATENLMEVVQSMGAAAYQQEPSMGGAPEDGEEPSDSGEEDDVVEGEFKEAEEDKETEDEE
jgi:molecular chaperone DnaK